MASFPDGDQSMVPLVSYLFARREAILLNWRSACDQDPMLEDTSSFSREEFNNLLPLILDILEQRLLKQPEQADPAVTAQVHGLHRWHKAHSLIQTVRELGWLTQVISGEIASFESSFPQFDCKLLLEAHRQVTILLQETGQGSVQKYDELQQLQAANRVTALQLAVNQFDELNRQRSELLRASSHDLRSGIGIAASASQLLQLGGLSESERAQYLDMLSRNLTAVQTLLTDLMDLSRLEAGQEKLAVQSVNAGELLAQSVANAQAMATERHILLRGDGPAQLLVNTDPVKVQRIVQNLVTNALKYTKSSAERPGVVSVSWAKAGGAQWVFSVQDSGSGLPRPVLDRLGGQLRPTVELTAVLGPNQGEPVAAVPTQVPPATFGPALTNPGEAASAGEGVGLQIVKQLCELLNATLDIESEPERGTLFRVQLPV